MPFTLAHPIAAAPIWLFSKKSLNLPGLVVGAMIPDIEYFIALQPIRTVGHTFIGILIQGIPCSIVLLLIARYVLLYPFLALLPSKLAQRFPEPGSNFLLQPLRVFNVVGSIVIGAITHLLWDAFTHESGWFVIHSTLLQSWVGALPVYKWLQYGSGLIGCFALSIWLFVWLSQSPSQTQVETLALRWRRLAICAIASLAGIFVWLAVNIHAVIGESIQAIIVRAVIGCISGLFIGLFLYSVLFWTLNRFKFEH